MENNILLTLIKDRINLQGYTQEQLSSMLDIKQAQLSRFLLGKGAISGDKTMMLLKILGISLDGFNKRKELAVQVANILRKKELTVTEMTKAEMVDKTGINDIKYFIDVDDSETLKGMINSGLIEPESTFVYFKAYVMSIMELMNKGAVFSSDDETPDKILPSVHKKTKEVLDEKLTKDEETDNYISGLGLATGAALTFGGFLLYKAFNYLFKDED